MKKDAKPRPDTSKNGIMKKNQLDLKSEAVKERARGILNRLGSRVDKDDQTITFNGYIY